MANGVADLALAIGGSLELSIIAKITALLNSALLVAHLARRSRASVRHALFALTRRVACLAGRSGSDGATRA